jgi:hypothetical protein
MLLRHFPPINVIWTPPTFLTMCEEGELMTIESYSLRAFWGARSESVAECAEHLLEYVLCLGQWDESCRTWYKTADSLEEALQQRVMLDQASLEQVLLSGRHYTDFERRPMEELGYRVNIWNGRDPEKGDQAGISMGVTCGCYSRFVPNQCEVTLPYQGTGAARVLHVSYLQELMQCVAHAWKPA